MVTPPSASTFSGSVASGLRDGVKLPKMFALWYRALGISSGSVLWSADPLCKGVNGVCFRLQERYVARSKACKQDCVRTVASCFAVRLLNGGASMSGCSYCFCLGVFKIVTRDSFVVWYPHVGCWARANFEEPSQVVSHCTGHPKIALYYFVLGPRNKNEVPRAVLLGI